MIENETWVLYDRHRKPLSKFVPRNFDTSPDEFHLSVHIWIKSDNKFLIFKRSPTKFTYPNYYEPIGGGVNGYDTPLNTAIRETKEESGLTVKEEQLTQTFSVRNENIKYCEFCDVFVFETNAYLEDVIIEEGKNCNPQFLTKDEIFKLIDDKKMIPQVSYREKIKKF